MHVAEESVSPVLQVSPLAVLLLDPAEFDAMIPAASAGAVDVSRESEFESIKLAS